MRFRYRRATSSRMNGFALITVLWVLVGMTTIALMVVMGARRSVQASSNRMDLIRAQWHSEQCLSVVMAAIDGELGRNADSANPTAPAWRTLDAVVAADAAVQQVGCNVSLKPVGTAVDVNTAGREQLLLLFAAIGMRPEKSDSLADAILYWRGDSTQVSDPESEEAWYIRHHDVLPRRAPLDDIRELQFVRGFRSALDSFPELASALTVEPGRLLADRAPRAVLLSVASLPPGAVPQLLKLRAGGNQIGNIRNLANWLPRPARDSLLGVDQELQKAFSSEPDAWIATVTAGRNDSSGVVTVVEVKIVRGAGHAAVIRRRVWP